MGFMFKVVIAMVVVVKVSTFMFQGVFTMAEGQNVIYIDSRVNVDK